MQWFLVVLVIGMWTSLTSAQTTYPIDDIVSTNAQQDESARRMARLACREAKAQNPGTPAPFGFDDNAECTGASTPTGIGQWMHRRLERLLLNAVQNLRDEDGKEVAKHFANLTTPQRNAIKAACPLCVFPGE